MAATDTVPVYTVPEGKRAIVAWLSLCNVDSSARTYSLKVQFRQSGGNIGVKRHLRKNTNLGVGDTDVHFEGGFGMNAGDKIFVSADVADKIDLVLAGFEA